MWQRSVPALAFAVSAAACEPPICPEGTLDEERTPVPTFADWGFIVPEIDRWLLVTGSEEAVQCHVIRSDWSLGQRVCSIVGFDYEPRTDSHVRATGAANDRKLAVVRTDSGVRVVTKSYLVDVDFDEPLARRVSKIISPFAASPDGAFLIEAVFPALDPVLVLWSFPTGVTTREGEVRDLGVGRLLEDTVEIVGAPFYTGVARDVNGGFAPSVLGGGRDPVSGHLWVDSPDTVHVLEFAADGTLLRIAEHVPPESTAHVSLDDWVALPDGRWAALGGGTTLCVFDAIDRSSKRCLPLALTPAPDGEPDGFDAQLLQDGGVLAAWHIGPSDPISEPGRAEAIFLGTWDGDAGARGGHSTYRLKQCDCRACGGIENF